MQQENMLLKNNTLIDKRLLRLEHAKQGILRQLYALGMKQGKLWEEKGFSLKAKTLRDLRVVAIMDIFTLTCFQPECQLFELTPSEWRSEIERAQPDIFFLESAWRGKDETWNVKISSYSTELYALIEYCHAQKIPVVFWCKEDPPHNDVFMHVAHMADIVFTTDIDCVEIYKSELGHDFVYHLHFAAQPLIHNPLEIHDRKNKFVFAGSYPSWYKERCRIFDELSEYFIRSRGMDIYDRNCLSKVPTAMFPEKYTPYILGGLETTEIDIAYKGYFFGVNMNSIQESQTMFARRAFELMASNTVVVSNASRGLKNYFGDLTICTDDPEEMEKKVQERCDNQESMDKFRLAALRKVLRQHLYEDRLDFIVSKVFGCSLKRKPPEILVCARVSSQKEANRVLQMFRNQSYPAKKFVLVSNEVLSCEGATVISVNRFWEELPVADYIAWFHSDDWYGENYLLDMALATRYGEFDVIGKEERYVNMEGEAVRQSYGQAYRLQEMLPARRSMIRATVLQKEELPWQTEYRAENILAVDAFNYCENWQEAECPVAADLNIPNQGISLDRMEEAASLITPMTKNFPAVCITSSEIASTELPAEYFFLREENGEAVLESRTPENENKWYFCSDFIPISVHLDEKGKLPLEILAVASCKVFFRCAFYDMDCKLLSRKSVRMGRRERVEVPPFASVMRLEISPRETGTVLLRQITIGENAFRVANRCFIAEGDL